VRPARTGTRVTLTWGAAGTAVASGPSRARAPVRRDELVRIAIGLPKTTLNVPRRLLVDWARRARERGFTSLATIDRLAYPSYDSLTTTAAAAVTDRIGLVTNLLLEPAYDPVLLAKVTASLDQISGGRLTLGVGVGRRADDYELAGRSFGARGRRLESDLELLHRAWAGEPLPGSGFPVGPPTKRGRIPLLIGGEAQRAAPRAARWQAGYTLGGAPPEMAAGAIQEFKTAFEQAGGTGQPRIVALTYFSLGDDHVEESLRNLRTYYGFLGDWAEAIATGATRTPQEVNARAAAFEELGVDELVFNPTVASLDQVDRLADVLL
jgi:alkanesulfonate monooxygenase SsuD/methylene tetrahydromethanopterin reductase-like flavin-dependent oxidoreductase (luciferase family)